MSVEHEPYVTGTGEHLYSAIYPSLDKSLMDLRSTDTSHLISTAMVTQYGPQSEATDLIESAVSLLSARLAGAQIPSDWVMVTKMIEPVDPDDYTYRMEVTFTPPAGWGVGPYESGQ